MKALMVALTIFLTFNTAQARFSDYWDVDLSKETLISKVEAIADELETNDHSQKVLNMTFNRSRVIRKKLDWLAPKLKRKNDATDEDIMPLLQDIVTALDSRKCFRITLYKVNRHLDKILRKLENNREVVTEIAVLNFEETGTLDFGLIFAGTSTDRFLTLTNSGNGVATNIIETNLVSPFSVVANPSACQDTLAPGASCTLIVRFAPQSVLQDSQDLIIDYFDGSDAQSISFPLTGASQ